jgi:tetratricopeptide (TPR) repeat protein
MKRILLMSNLSPILAILLLGQSALAFESGENKTKEGSYSTSNEVLMIKQRDTLRLAGLSALYSVDYNQAQNVFEKLVLLDPEDPAGYVYQAINVWFRCTYRTRRLHTSLYNNSNFESDIIRGTAQVEADVEKKFHTLLETARAKAELRLKKNKKDAEALFFMAASYSTQAGYEATISDKYFAALRNSSKAIELNKKVLKLDPKFTDAYLTVGIYDYVVANLPLGFRMMGSIFGLRGNKARGIATLERVVKEGHYNSDDARIVLATIYEREKRYEDAVAILRELQDRHPTNCLPQLEIAALMVRTNRHEEALKIFEQLLSGENKQQSADLIRFHYGDALIAMGKLGEASQQFLALAETKDCDRQLAVLAHYRAGQAYDLAKKRNLAIEQYKQVLNCENAYNIHEKAKEYLKKSYERGLK